jgi:large subunit ribosomal protein L17
MRHLKKLKKLGLKKSHREALIRNLIVSLAMHGRVRTTKTRAKVLQARFDHMLRIVHKKTPREAIRLLPRYCHLTSVSKKIVTELAPKYKDRTSGFTRLTPVGMRKGDNTPIVQIELL